MLYAFVPLDLICLDVPVPDGVAGGAGGESIAGLCFDRAFTELGVQLAVLFFGTFAQRQLAEQGGELGKEPAIPRRDRLLFQHIVRVDHSNHACSVPNRRGGTSPAPDCVAVPVSQRDVLPDAVILAAVEHLGGETVDREADVVFIAEPTLL